MPNSQHGPGIKYLLEWIDGKKENILQPCVKRYWPRFITPNMLTGSRIIIGGVILWPLALWQGFEDNYLILSLLIFAALTDLIDGSVARTLDQKSPFGSLLDKIADKCLVLPLGVVEFWVIDPLLVVVSVPGMGVVMYTSINRYSEAKHQAPPENIFGKFATTCYFLIIILAIWPEAWTEARIIGWTGFALGCLSAIRNHSA